MINAFLWNVASTLIKMHWSKNLEILFVFICADWPIDFFNKTDSFFEYLYRMKFHSTKIQNARVNSRSNMLQRRHVRTFEWLTIVYKLLPLEKKWEKHSNTIVSKLKTRDNFRLYCLSSNQQNFGTMENCIHRLLIQRCSDIQVRWMAAEWWRIFQPGFWSRSRGSSTRRHWPWMDIVRIPELSTGRMDPRVGSGRVGSGRVGSGHDFCRILAGRVGSGQHFGFLVFLSMISWYLNRYALSITTLGLIDFLRHLIYNN